MNFAAGRLDAEHDPGVALEDLEEAVRAAGYGVAKAEQAETTLLAYPEALSVFVSALLFVLGLALSLIGAPEIDPVGAYTCGHRGWGRADLPGGPRGTQGPSPTWT